MNAMLVNEVNIWADRNHVLQPGTTVVVGVSGGSDSVCLLHVLHTLKEPRSFSIVAVHINHMLRGDEADADQRFVQSICGAWGIPLKVFKEDIRAVSAQKGCSIEEAGRMTRYECFYRVLKEANAQYIAVAHHSQDQAETVFLHLLRGSGLDGLCGMDTISKVIIRPLLETDKNKIIAYIHANKLEYRVDSSNLENAYTRNAIRNSIFPKIQTETGFPISRSLLRAARLLRQDRDYLRLLAQEKYNEVIVSKDKKTVIFTRSGLNRLHPSIGSRVVRFAWEEITGGMSGIEQKHISAFLALSAAKKTGKTIQLPGGVSVYAEYDRIIITNKHGESFHSTAPPVPVRVPSSMNLSGWDIRIQTMVYHRDEYVSYFGIPSKQKENSLFQIFDYDSINGGINIRSRQPGDMFFPYQSPGSKKLKDFLIDQKIPRTKRENIPLLAAGKNIIWVIGHRTSENYKVNETTGKILRVEVSGDGITSGLD